jgi:hypothetical protein
MLLPPGARLASGIFGMFGPPQGLSVLAHFLALAPIDFLFGVPVPLPRFAAAWLEFLTLAIGTPFPEPVVKTGLSWYITSTSYDIHYWQAKSSGIRSSRTK